MRSYKYPSCCIHPWLCLLSSSQPLFHGDLWGFGGWSMVHKCHLPSHCVRLESCPGCHPEAGLSTVCTSVFLHVCAFVSFVRAHDVADGHSPLLRLWMSWCILALLLSVKNQFGWTLGWKSFSANFLKTLISEPELFRTYFCSLILYVWLGFGLLYPRNWDPNPSSFWCSGILWQWTHLVRVQFECVLTPFVSWTLMFFNSVKTSWNF